MKSKDYESISPWLQINHQVFKKKSDWVSKFLQIWQKKDWCSLDWWRLENTCRKVEKNQVSTQPTPRPKTFLTWSDGVIIATVTVASYKALIYPSLTDASTFSIFPARYVVIGLKYKPTPFTQHHIMVYKVPWCNMHPIKPGTSANFCSMKFGAS